MITFIFMLNLLSESFTPSISLAGISITSRSMNFALNQSLMNSVLLFMIWPLLKKVTLKSLQS